MYPHDYLFYGGCAFLVGVAGALLGVPPLFISIGSLLGITGFFIHGYIMRDAWVRAFSICIVFVIVGSWFASVRTERFFSVPIVYNQSIEFFGCIKTDPKIRESSQEATLRVREPFIGDVRLRMRSNEVIRYGDCVRGTGTIISPDIKQSNYFLKEGIYGTISYPKVVVVEERDESIFMKGMLWSRNRILHTFERVLQNDEAVFLAGLTIGAKGEFPKNLQDEMKRSGTTHLVALSGYNIMIIIGVILFVCGKFLKKSHAILCTAFIIFLFSIFAGSESSLVRAGILGCIGLGADMMGRVFDARQAIISAAILMVLVNPFVLLFDIGFQLSFAAFLGIIYGSPAIIEFLRIRKENIITKALIDSVSAQLFTFPIIALQFGTISFVGIISGVILLAFIPYTMLFGFLGAGLSFISPFLAWIPLLFASIFLKFELLVIHLLGSIQYIEWSMNEIVFVLYYVALGIGVWIYLKKRNARNRIFNM